MRTFLIIIALLSISYSTEMGNSTQIVMPLKKGIKVYQNKIRGLNEDFIFKMDIDNRYLILESTDKHIKVKADNGKIGWVEKRLVKKIKASSGFIFENKLVEGYEVTPVASLIWGDVRWKDTLILPDRSFSENIKVNIDRETIARIK